MTKRPRMWPRVTQRLHADRDTWKMRWRVAILTSGRVFRWQDWGIARG